MNEEVQPNLLLEADNELYLLFDELVILGIGDLALAKLRASTADLLGLLWGSRQTYVNQ